MAYFLCLGSGNSDDWQKPNSTRKCQSKHTVDKSIRSQRDFAT
jgi:hypothetical protein